MNNQQRLQIGLLGCGPIAQHAHLPALMQTRNATLYAICDAAPEIRAYASTVFHPTVAYASYDEMLADTRVQAVIIAVDDRYHIPLALQALAAGKHVLLEKPMGVTIEECEQLAEVVRQTGLVLQVGHNRRFEPGVLAAKRFVEQELGAIAMFRAWYYDSVYRYTMQDQLFLPTISSSQVKRPAEAWKSIKTRYLLLAHGSHIVDLTRFIGGEIRSVMAHQHRQELFWQTPDAIGLQDSAAATTESYTWSVELEFVSGALGHLNLILPICGDYQEGFEVFGQRGTVHGQWRLPWFQTAEVTCFATQNTQYHTSLGVQSNTFLNQIESFAQTILTGTEQQGATVYDGVQCLRTLVAISQSVQSGQRVFPSAMTGGIVIA